MRHSIAKPALLAASIAVLATPALAGAKHARPAARMQQKGLVGVPAANKAALQTVRGRVTSCKPENEDGKLLYAVKVQNGPSLFEVMVDAHTGKVTTTEKVTLAEERREEAAEARAQHSAAPSRHAQKH